MSQNDEKTNDAQLARVFDRVRQVEFEASPYLAARVLARVREDQATRRQIWFWRALAGSAFAIGAVALLLNFKLLQSSSGPSAVVAQAYVIHVDFDPSEVASVEEVEVELPDGVKFYSKSRANELEGLQKLKLPLNRSLAGRNKLPFVVQSAVSGEQSLKVRLFDSEGSLIRERQLKVSFKGSETTMKL